MQTSPLFRGIAGFCNLCVAASTFAGTNPAGADYANLPISFEANIGQADPAVRFLSHGHGGNLLLMQTEACLTVQKHTRTNEPPRLLRLRLSGANPNPTVEGLNRLPGKANYFSGTDTSRWRTDVATFSKVRYKNVYPGVDLIYYGNRQKLEYDFVIQPGANPDVIVLEFTGAKKIRVDPNGELMIDLPGDSVRQHRPIVYQEIAGKRKTLSGSYIVRSATQVAFRLSEYDKGKTLIIDPVLSYSATFGGSGLNQALAVAVDSQNNVYITGNTTSTDFRTTSAFQTNLLGAQDAFVIKLNTNGAVVFSTFLGGGALKDASITSGQGIAAGTNGNVFVAGYTSSTNFPTKNPLQSTNASAAFDRFNAFVTELSPDGNALVYSTYLGGNGLDAANGIALDPDGNAIVTGYTSSTNFPTANAAQPVYGGGNGDAFVAKLNAAGNALIYSTYLGGNSTENLAGGPNASTSRGDGGAIAVDYEGNASVTGWTYSTNFPVLSAFQPTNASSYPDTFSSSFVTKLDPAGALVYSTYFGGQLGNSSRAIGIDLNKNVYIAGADQSGTLPTTTNAFQSSFGGGANIGDGFVAAFDSAGAKLIYSTYVGGGGDDQINGIAVRRDGAVAVTGFTDSADFPVVNAVQPGGNQGFFRSTDSGSAWHSSNSGLASGVIYAIQVDPSNPSVMYALTKNGCFKSVDGGAHWTSASNGLGRVVPSYYGTSSPLMALDPLHPGTVYVGCTIGTTAAVFKTTNGAANWFSASAGLPSSQFFEAVNSVAVDPATPAIVYAGTSDQGVYKSADGGNSWKVMTNGLMNLQVQALLVDPQNSSNVYAGVANPFGQSLYKSTNGGGNWTLLSGLADEPVVALASAPGNRIYAVASAAFGEASTLYVSTNGGDNWSQLLDSAGLKFTALAVTVPAPALAIAGSGTNDNLSWPASFAGYVLQSTPSLKPANWQNVTQFPAMNNGNNVTAIPMSGAQGFYRLFQANNGTPSPPVIYLGTDQSSGQGVLESTDGGKTWNIAGLAGDTVNAVAVNPANSALVYAGLASGRDAFLSTFTPEGELYSSTYLGGSGADQGNAVATDYFGESAYVVGSTYSGGNPTMASLSFSSLHLLDTTPPPEKLVFADLFFAELREAERCPEGFTKTIGMHVGGHISYIVQDATRAAQIRPSSDQLPTGMSYSGSTVGNIAGTATKAGTYTLTFNFSFKRRDGEFCRWDETYIIIVSP